MIYLIQENGVMTLLGWNVDLFKFSDCWKFFLYNFSNKRRRTYAKTMQSLVQMPLSCQTLLFHDGKIVIWPKHALICVWFVPKMITSGYI